MALLEMKDNHSVIKFPDMPQLAILLLVFLAGLLPARSEMPPLAEGAWTIAVIPDTQYYVRKDEDAGIFTEMTEWLAANRGTRNIKLVLHVGDIVNDNEDRQWAHAKSSMKVLDGKLPYIQPDGHTVKVRTFSPYLARTADDPAKAWRRGPDCEFTFGMDHAAKRPATK